MDDEPQVPVAQSALAEALPNSLDHYFSMNPNDMSDKDLDIVVQKLRDERARWQQDEAKGAKSAKPSAEAKKAAKAAVSLSDLGL